MVRPRREQLAVAVILLLAGGLALLAGCQSSTSAEPAQPPAQSQGGAPSATPAAAPSPTASAAPATQTGAYLLFNQRWVEGLRTKALDLEDVDEVFRYVFSRLPERVTVYPTENYYYFILYVNGRQVWGNIRLPAGRREQGVLSFAYFEFDEFLSLTQPALTYSKYFTRADGLIIKEVDPFTYLVDYAGRAVTFNFLKLPQVPPKLFPLAKDEVFVERTFDESGYQFFLLFHERKNYFLWVLNEEEGVPDALEPLGEDLLVGKRSGFGFWKDAANGGRKVLVGVRQLSVARNDYFDGPFDQLADNYAKEVGVSEYMQRAYPSLRGRIDKYGYYTDREDPLRVAISTYYSYVSRADLLQFMGAAQATGDPYLYISRREVAPPSSGQPTEQTSPPRQNP